MSFRPKRGGAEKSQSKNGTDFSVRAALLTRNDNGMVAWFAVSRGGLPQSSVAAPLVEMTRLRSIDYDFKNKKIA